MLPTFLHLCAIVAAAPPVADAVDPGLLGSVRQLTFAGERAGEGYFSPDGRYMIFQSEREPGNPFFQIYLMDRGTGETRRLSTGVGRTTCAWIHPGMKKALFSSTHQDPAARAKQEQEIESRRGAPQARERWVYDECFDIYEVDLETGALRRLTDARGYDAEASYSPDGRTILFASNRHAYGAGGELEKDPGKDPSYFMDIYVMDAGGASPRRLTTAEGYDGGPFYSADGSRIVWRRFSADGLRAEVFTTPAAGGGPERQLTRLNAMSWAPFFHPSGAYVIFTTNRHGFDNFELYCVDAEGARDPVRATVRPGFDGLPAFTPDGKHLAWTSNRTANEKGQIFIAGWDHEKALRLLGLAREAAASAQPERPPDGQGAREPLPALPPLAATATSAAITAQDLYCHVAHLASPELEGRLTGTAGERAATAYVASVFEQLGFEPAGEAGGFFQEFEFTAGVSLGPDNALTMQRADTRAPATDTRAFATDKDWRPLSFSANGDFAAAPVVFAGYGIVAPAADGHPAYDAYGDLDVKAKWVLVFRYVPEDIDQKLRVHLSAFSNLRFKAMEARERGAAGLVVATGPRAQVKSELAPIVLEGTPQGTSIAAVSVTNAVAEALLAGTGRRLEDLQKSLDGGEPGRGFALEGVTVAARIDLTREKRAGRNVLARLRAPDSEEDVIIGAHVDHIGRGEGHGSLARPEERGLVHPGADDNASGVAALLEIAQELAHLKAAGEFRPARGVLFAAWSGEEMGLLGSGHFVGRLAGAAAGSGSGGGSAVHPRVAAYLNMDMVGRLTDKCIIYGVGSSSAWPALIERHNVAIGLPLAVNDDRYLPTDATSFSTRGVPFLSAFTGVHADYNTPRDTADRINYDDMARIALLVERIARSVAAAPQPPDFTAGKAAPTTPRGGGGRRVTLGTVPDFSGGDLKGVKISGATPGSPAERAGLRAGDIVVELAGKKIENLYDYSYAIGALKPGVPTEIVIERDGQRLTLQVTPAPRE